MSAKQNSLYLPAGWVNPARIFTSSCPIVICLGGRGIGKTYGCLSYTHEHKIPFVYMRRTQAQLDAVSIPALNPFNQAAADQGFVMTCKKSSKYSVEFRSGEDPDQPPDGIGIALSTFANIRGMSAERYDVLLFDEIIPERHERPIKEESSAFLNVIESLNRNRELSGKGPMKIILLSNTNTINSKILDSIGATMVIDKMIRRGQQVQRIGDLIEVIRYTDSPISEKKSGTLLYQIANNADFVDMSINNKFSASDFEAVRLQPLAEYVPLVIVAGVTVYRHKSLDRYYIVDRPHTGIKEYGKLPLALKEFRKKYYYLYKQLITGHIYYNSIKSKMIFEDIWR